MTATTTKICLIAPAALGAALGMNALPTAAQMATLDQIKDYIRQGAAQQQAQVTSVSEFSDVKPTDWAFLALQSLVERYGCIAGYPTNPPTFKGNRALTRYEFAAGLNACLDRINELIAAATEPLATKEELAKVQKLQEMFAAELATLRGRVDSLEARTATLEAQQFSTTTKLRGEAIFAVGGLSGDEAFNAVQQAQIDRGQNVQPGARLPNNNVRNSVNDNTIFGYRVRLNFQSSFTGQDLLLTRLNMADIPNFALDSGTQNTRLSFDGTTGGNVTLDRLYYRFPFDAGKGRLQIGPIGNATDTLFDTYNPLASDGNAALSRFGRYNPFIYRFGNVLGGGSGALVDYRFNSKVSVSGAYLVPPVTGTDPSNGIFGSTNTAALVVNVTPVKNFKFGVGYSRYYGTGEDGVPGQVNISGDAGTDFSSDPFGALNGQDVPTSANSANLMFSWQATPKFILSGWFGYTVAEALSNGPVSATIANPALKNSRTNGRATAKGDTADIITAALTFAFPDPFGRKGDLGGVIVGIPPYVTRNEARTAIAAGNGQPATIVRREDQTVPVHLEGLYRFQVNRNLSITPGFFTIINPEGNSRNDAIFVYSVRSTFTF